MAKSGKHKKIRRQEKAKTQLKGGLKTILGKAQNVIEPKLQSKKIVVREQLKSAPEGDVATTRRKQSLSDVLGALSHHNTNIKTDALSGLYELITTGTNILEGNLGRIVDKVGLLTSDMESSVRKENFRVAEALLSQVSEAELQPFWNLLLTHLKCTLTDLNPAVRQSCLSFIALLLTSCPNLAFASRSTILPSILNLISNTSASSAKNNVTRLNLDIADKASGVKVRTRVLSLIASCLDLKSASASVDKDRQPCSETQVEWSNAAISVTDTAHLNLYCGSEYYENENHRYSEGGRGRSVSLSNNSDSFANPTRTHASQQQGEHFMADFIQSCFPVLCETWIELAPSSKILKNHSDRKTASKKRQEELKENDTSSSQLNKTAIEVLQCVVNVMIQITCCEQSEPTIDPSVLNSRNENDTSIKVTRPKYRATQEGGRYRMREKLFQDLKKSFGPDLQKYFFNFLPFSCAQENQRQTLIKINLQLFNVAAQLKLFDRQLMDKFEHYVNGMMKKESVSPELVTLVLDTGCLIKIPRIGKLLSSAIVFAVETGCQAQAYSFLKRNLALNANPDDNKCALSVEWERVLPVLIADLISDGREKLHEELVDVLTLIAIRNLGDLREHLRDHKDTIIQKFVQGSAGFNVKDRINRLFFYTDYSQEVQMEII